MKNVIILILGCLWSIVGFAQEMPFDMDSLLEGKDYQLVQYLPEEVLEIDSSQLPPYYEGGVLVQPLEKIYSYDTFYTAAYEDIPSHKLEAYSMQTPMSKEIRMIIPQPIKYLPCQLDSIHSIRIKAYMPIHYTIIPPTGGNVITNYTIKAEFEYQYPRGIPRKVNIIRNYHYDEPYVISWETWEDMTEEEKNSDEVSFFEIRAGYYKAFHPNDQHTKCMITKVQYGLLKKAIMSIQME